MHQTSAETEAGRISSVSEDWTDLHGILPSLGKAYTDVKKRMLPLTQRRGTLESHHTKLALLQCPKRRSSNHCMQKKKKRQTSF